MKNKQLTNNKSPIKTAGLLLNNFYPKEKIISILNIKLPTFYKNLNLIKTAGFEFEKEKSKYKIASFSKSIHYSSLNTSIMAHILTLSFNFFPKNKTQALMFILKKFLYLSCEEEYEDFLKKYKFFQSVSLNSIYKNKIKMFRRYAKKRTILSIETKNMQKQKLKPLEHISHQGETFFTFLNTVTNDKEKIRAQDIIEMTPYKETFCLSGGQNTIFELSGRLAKTYLLKENEVLIDTSRDKITISNFSNNKQKLFKRLLRYDILCEVKFTKQDRIDFQKLLKKSLDNIEKFQDNSSK